MINPAVNHSPEWQAEKDHLSSCQQLRQALREVKDPELGMDVIQLGLIRDVIIDDKHVLIKMILTTPFCPFAPAMMKAVQQKAEGALGLNVKVELDHQAWDSSMMENNGEASWGIY
jgi:metal-sulfur cluster biosynthetic enzyme